MTGRLLVVLFSAVAWAQLALGKVVPADPTITAPAVLPRQNANNFMGWVEYEGVWSSLTCDPGGTWYQSGKYGQCCPETAQSCYAPTACVAGSQIYPYPDLSSTTTIACTENYSNASMSICNTVFIFESFGDSNPKTDIVCGEESLNWSLYRKIPATATETSNSQSVPPGPSKTTSKSGSKAWIAGAVVGPLVGLALIGLILFFLRRNKNKKSAQALAQGGAAMTPLDPSRPPAGVAGYTDAKPYFPPAEQQAYYAVPTDTTNPHQQVYAHQAYSDGSPSPAPQYAPPAIPPLQNPYPNAAELGGGGGYTAGTAAHPAPTAYTAELAGQPAGQPAGKNESLPSGTQPSELSGNAK